MKKVWKKTCAAVCSAAMALSATSVAFAAEDAEQELRMQYGNALDIYANPTEDLYGDCLLYTSLFDRFVRIFRQKQIHHYASISIWKLNCLIVLIL